MAKNIDMELKKAFAELQQKMIDTSQKLRLADAQIDSLKRSKQHAEITEREVSALTAGTRTYDSVGRMFVLTELPAVKASLRKRQATAQDKISTLESSKSYLERSLKDSENNLREMVAQRKEVA